jgi:hypothetical protein
MNCPSLLPLSLLSLCLAALTPLTGLHAQSDSAAAVPTVTLKSPPARLSPHETLNLHLSRAEVIMIVYGRPHTKKPGTDTDRTVWGGELVPYGKIWRLGADEATVLITPKPLVIGTTDPVNLPAGTYTLFLYPESADSAKLVISRQIGEWGLSYDAKQDLGRVTLTKAKLSEPIHQFQMGIDKARGGGTIKLMWEDTQYSVPFTVGK